MWLRHTSEKSLQGLTKQDLLKDFKTFKLKFCEHCVIGKKIKVKFDTAVHYTKKNFDYVHIDVWGPIKAASIGSNHCFVSFIDDFSRQC